jgi:hypothetical protein
MYPANGASGKRRYMIMRERAINLISNTLEKNAACDENTDRQTQIAICYIVLHPLVNEAVAPEAAVTIRQN